MNPIYLFEAGSTKTTLLINKAGKTIEHHLPGFNPNRYSAEFEEQLKATIQIENDAKIFFFGSGLVEEENKKIVKELIYNLYRITPVVYDDVTGAARAVLGDNAGLVAIMGTGGVAAYYDGTKIIKRNGGYGYLIDDYGGGLELGKILLSKWLNNDLDANVDVAITDFVKTPKSDFIIELYQNIDLKIIAGVVKIIPQFLDNSKIDELVKNYFTEFFKRHVLSLTTFYKQNTIAIIGSIGANFQDIITGEAQKFGIKVTKFDNEPAKALLDYHLKKTSV